MMNDDDHCQELGTNSTQCLAALTCAYYSRVEGGGPGGEEDMSPQCLAVHITKFTFGVFRTPFQYPSGARELTIRP